MSWDQVVIWAWYAAILWLGTRLTRHQKPLPILGAALASSVSFFVITNFAVWAATELYPKNFTGLLTSYTVAIPFFRHSIFERRPAIHLCDVCHTGAHPRGVVGIWRRRPLRCGVIS